MVALELFYKKGYENTTIKDIIEEIGVSKGAFYHYFESKEDVIVAIAKEFHEPGLCHGDNRILHEPGKDNRPFVGRLYP